MRSNAETNADSSPDADVATADSSPSITITPAMRPDFVIDNLGVLADAGGSSRYVCGFAKCKNLINY